MDTGKFDVEIGTDIVLATDVLQAQERLYLSLRSKDNASQKVLQRATDILDSLRNLKSDIEKSNTFPAQVHVDTTVLQDQIRPLILMNVYPSLSVDTRSQIYSLVEQAFQGSCRCIKFIGLMANPWYMSIHDDPSLQAKHNTLFVVYSFDEDQLLCPVEHIPKERNQVVDEGWFTAFEIGHVAQYMVRGSVSFLEAICLPEAAVIHQSVAWMQLAEALRNAKPWKLRGFLEQAVGQAVGKIARKNHKGNMGLRSGATMYEFCQSFSLLLHVQNAIADLPMSLEKLEGPLEGTDGYSHEAFTKLQQIYTHEGDDGSPVNKEQLLEIVLKWKTHLNDRMNKQYSNPKDVEECISKQLLNFRLDGRKLQEPKFRGTEEEERTLVDLLRTIDGRTDSLLAKLAPAQIIMVAQAGSALYDLQVPTSDMDYIIVYADSAQDVLGSCKKRATSFERRGPSLNVEYGAYEAERFADMLWKGSVVILELAFSENLLYTSSAWNELVSNKRAFLTERAILQYFGLIKNNMKQIESEKFKNNPRERKLFYQAFHKLDTLEYFLRGEIPSIKCHGDVKDFIMKIRRGPLEGDISRDSLVEKATSKIRELKSELSKRKYRLSENTPPQIFTEWLKEVRGWNS